MDRYNDIASKGYLWIYDIKNNRITKQSNVLIMNSWISNEEFNFYINDDGNYIVYGLKNDDEKAYKFMHKVIIEDLNQKLSTFENLVKY